MTADIIIDSKNAASAAVRVRDRIVFWLSWALWAALLLQILHSAAAKGAALAGAIDGVYRYWMLPAEEPDWFHLPARYSVSLAVLVCILAWSVLKRAQSHWKPQQQETRALQLLESSIHFGVNPRRLFRLQWARRVVIRHTRNGQIAEITSSTRDSPTRQSPLSCVA